jgi:5'-deoxy-5'-methylthioadenosine phosphorylase
VARIGLIGGTGLDDWPGQAQALALDTRCGAPSGELQRFEVQGHELFFLPRHGPRHDIPPHRVNYRANLLALQQQGVQAVLAVNAVGSLAADAEPGCLVVPDQLIDYTSGRVSSFWDQPGGSMLHVELTDPFDLVLRTQLLDAARALDLPVLDGGCVGVTQGPRLETAAEIRRLERDGCMLVGMTSLPEAALARELDLPYASLCVVANWAAGLSPEPITMTEIEATLAQAMQDARAVVGQWLSDLAA